jgi:hypothetical protein
MSYANATSIATSFVSERQGVLLQDLPERVRFEVLSLASTQVEVVAESKPEALWSQFH